MEDGFGGHLLALQRGYPGVMPACREWAPRNWESGRGSEAGATGHACGDSAPSPGPIILPVLPQLELKGITPPTASDGEATAQRGRRLT